MVVSGPGRTLRSPERLVPLPEPESAFSGYSRPSSARPPSTTEAQRRRYEAEEEEASRYDNQGYPRDMPHVRFSQGTNDRDGGLRYRTTPFQPRRPFDRGGGGGGGGAASGGGGLAGPSTGAPPPPFMSPTSDGFAARGPRGSFSGLGRVRRREEAGLGGDSERGGSQSSNSEGRNVRPRVSRSFIPISQVVAKRILETLNEAVTPQEVSRQSCGGGYCEES